ncbi:hypothetical protein FBU30_006716 [Linnemannia zychae]|nr:hypothetical protein FBU30_006716 [Linnemannia zychae]
MATTSTTHSQETAVSISASTYDDSRHIYTVAAKSLQDCVELLRSLKAAMAVEAEEIHKAQEQLQQPTIGNSNLKLDDSIPTGKSMRDIHHMSRSASQEAEQDRDNNDNESSANTPKHPRAPSSLPQAITPCPRSEMYTKPSVLACQGTIGKHVRHLHDHYRLLLSTFPPAQGLSQENQWSVDYDKRSREVPMESDIDYAVEELEALQLRLERHVATLNLNNTPKQQNGTTAELDATMPNDLLQPITLMATIDPAKEPVSFQSTFGRELWFCSLHAVHHFAMIKVICAEFGMSLTEGFGVAPSTLKSRMAHH